MTTTIRILFLPGWVVVVIRYLVEYFKLEMSTGRAARGLGHGFLRAGPGRHLPARTFENFCNNKQIVSPSLQLRLLWSAALRRG